MHPASQYLIVSDASQWHLRCMSTGPASQTRAFFTGADFSESKAKGGVRFAACFDPVLLFVRLPVLCCLQVPPSGPITVFIRLPNVSSFECIRIDSSAFIGDIKSAILLNFKLDTTPQLMRVLKLGNNGGNSRLLDSTQTLAEAGIQAGTKLVVELLPPPPPPPPSCHSTAEG
jgi:hypothetical protein